MAPITASVARVAFRGSDSNQWSRIWPKRQGESRAQGWAAAGTLWARRDAERVPGGWLRATAASTHLGDGGCQHLVIAGQLPSQCQPCGERQLWGLHGCTRTQPPAPGGAEARQEPGYRHTAIAKGIPNVPARSRGCRARRALSRCSREPCPRAAVSTGGVSSSGSMAATKHPMNASYSG